jgi:hypothetical protein
VNGTGKKNKTEDTNKLTLLAFKIIAILHNTLLATFIKLLETVSKGKTAVTRSWIAATSAGRAPFTMLFRRENRQKSTHRIPLIWRLRAPDQGSTVDFSLFPRLKSIMKGYVLQTWRQSKNV